MVVLQIALYSKEIENLELPEFQSLTLPRNVDLYALRSLYLNSNQMSLFFQLHQNPALCLFGLFGL